MPATGRATPTWPRCTQSGAGTPTVAGFPASRHGWTWSAASPGSRSRPRTPTPGSTTSSTPTTTSSITAEWSRWCVTSPARRRRHTSVTRPCPRRSRPGRWPRRHSAYSGPGSSIRNGSPRCSGMATRVPSSWQRPWTTCSGTTPQPVSSRTGCTSSWPSPTSSTRTSASSWRGPTRGRCGASPSASWKQPTEACGPSPSKKRWIGYATCT